MVNTIKNISERWAYDIDKNPIDQGEIWDIDVINQSIEMILGTLPGERLFNPNFGLGLQYRIFEVMSNDEAENLLNIVSSAIKTWEDRIFLVESQMKIIADIDRHIVIIIIPYIIKRTGISSVFTKKIISNNS